MEQNLFDSIDEFYKSAEALSEASDRLLHESGSALGLRLDPFQLPIALHRGLRKLSDENDFSDWLHWTLLVACKHATSPVFLCKTLLSPESLEPADEKRDYEMPSIDREVQVEEGHEDRSGRLDLLIHFSGARLTWHIEVKRGSAEAADLGKNIGYSTALAAIKQYVDCRNILLVTEHKSCKYGNFAPLKWQDLCIRIRTWVTRYGNKGLDTAALLLLCAIVEQQLLQLAPRSLRQIDYIDKLVGENNAGCE